MSQLLEQKTNNGEQQPEQQFDLSKVAIDHVTSPYPRFHYVEIPNEDGKDKSRIGVATTDNTIGTGDKKSATGFAINANGEMSWTAGDEIELVIVRGEDDRVTELGTDGTENGIVQDLTARDEVYVVSKEFATIMKSVSSFNKDGFDTTMNSHEIKADVVRIRFNDARADVSVTDGSVEPVGVNQATSMSPAERRLNKRRIRQQDRLAALEQNDVMTPVYLTQAFADDEELQAQINAAKGYTVTDKRHNKTPGKELELYRGDVASDTSSLGISDAVRDELEIIEKERLAERVEKYTQKVASYEEIAAVALAKRMKGRLFNPLTRRNKENVQQDDLNMHLLEGFSRALDGAMMKQWLAEGYSDDEAAQMIYEHQQTRQEARATRNHDELRKDKLASFLDKYANMSKGKKIGAVVGAAAVFGTIGVVAGAAGGAVAVAGGIGLAGAKVGKTYFQHRSKIYETGRDESRRSPDALVSVGNGSATKRTATQQVFAGMDYDEKKREKAIQKADRNKKVAVGVAAISAVAIGGGVIAEHGDSIQKLWDRRLPQVASTEVGSADGSWVTELPASEAAPEAAPAPVVEFSIDASTVTNGEGWYQTIQEVTGPISATEQAAILQKIGPALQEKGWAYPMSDGTWGISRPGTLPKDVLELIKNSR